MPDQSALAQRLREAREWLGLSQEWVAERVGMPRASLSALEQGKRKVYASELPRFADLYRVSIETLLEREPTISDPRDETLHELFRQVAALHPADRETVLRFAEFLKYSDKKGGNT